MNLHYAPVIETQESERHRIARDLHDHIGQQLTGMRLKIERIASMLEDDHPAGTELAAISELAAKMDSDVGFLSWELRPTELDFLGLSDALKSFTAEWSRQYGISADFHSVPNAMLERLTNEVETSLYRILQEALNNVLKHAEATRVSVLLHRSATGVTLIIEDNGKGFFRCCRHGPGAGGLGVVGMKSGPSCWAAL